MNQYIANIIIYLNKVLSHISLEIIIPYLQIEKLSFGETIKNKFSKEGRDDL